MFTLLLLLKRWRVWALKSNFKLLEWPRMISRSLRLTWSDFSLVIPYDFLGKAHFILFVRFISYRSMPHFASYGMHFIHSIVAVHMTFFPFHISVCASFICIICYTSYFIWTRWSYFMWRIFRISCDSLHLTRSKLEPPYFRLLSSAIAKLHKQTRKIQFSLIAHNQLPSASG